MKKIFFVLAVLVMVFVSCDNTDSENVSNTVKLNITVANIGPDEPVTRAASIKDVWDVGDQISIWYDSNWGAIPDLVITYDGSEWIGPESITPPVYDSGYVKCLYDGRVKVASKAAYTYDSTTRNFFSNIDSWTCLTEIVVVVTDIPEGADASLYTLACDKFTPLSGDGYTVGADNITATTGTKGDAVTGFASYIYDGATAFVFATSDYSSSAQDFRFILATTGETKVYSENITLELSTKIQSITLAYSDFAAVSTEHEAVQLWEGGPYWATTNIGAETETETGYFFAWGYTDGYVRNSGNDGWVKAADSSVSITFDEAGFPDYATHAYSDMAQASWGTGWKMPTDTDFRNLLSNCDIEYVTTGTKGIRLTGRGAYSANSIFLPAAGYGDGSNNAADVFNADDYGSYWSSTQLDSYRAYVLDFYPALGYSNVHYDKKYYGSTVRPVRDFTSFVDENVKAY